MFRLDFDLFFQMVYALERSRRTCRRLASRGARLAIAQRDVVVLEAMMTSAKDDESLRESLASHVAIAHTRVAIAQRVAAASSAAVSNAPTTPVDKRVAVMSNTTGFGVCSDGALRLERADRRREPHGTDDGRNASADCAAARPDSESSPSAFVDPTASSSFAAPSERVPVANFDRRRRHDKAALRARNGARMKLQKAIADAAKQRQGKVVANEAIETTKAEFCRRLAEW